MLNNLHDATKAGQGASVIDKIILDLIEYTKYHFAEEEKLMTSINYSGIAAQKLAHTTFVDKMGEYKREIDKGLGVFVVTKVSKTGIDWLKEHILTMDKKYEDEMKAKGMR